METTFLMFSAFTAIITTIIFLLVYSKMYDWHKSKMGLIMNLSLMATVIPAIGTVLFYLVGRVLGITIGGIGWIAFSLLLVWRLRELMYYYKNTRRKLSDNINESDD